MFDFSHLPQNASVSEYVINAQFASSGTGPSYTWNKPPNCRLVFMLAIGGGGGGCGGPSVNGVSASGGGGGGSGAIAQALFLAESLSQILYIGSSSLAGAPNGLGGAPNSSGGSGVNVYISNYPDAAINPQSVSKYIYASGASGGQTTFSGTGGSAQSRNNVQLSQAAIYYTTVSGRNGTWGSSAPGSTTIGTGIPILGGGGGGGVNASLTSFNGAGFTSEISNILPSIDGGLALSALNASNGIRLPFIITGGSGGGAFNGGLGGRGGNGGGYGAGGGGGGVGTTGGRGGDGGPGYVCIIAW